MTVVSKTHAKIFLALFFTLCDACEQFKNLDSEHLFREMEEGDGPA